MKQIEIFDIEVFKHDWLFVARDPEKQDYTVIHNDNHALREYLNKNDLMLGGFNNKHYDDGIIHAMYHGADNDTVKAMNDFIIQDKGLWWEFPFVQFKKKSFQSFDLRDDLPLNLSLKAIEGNMGRAIVETSVPFDIDRKLNEAELEEVIEYCKVDVDNTVELYHKRIPYLESKKEVARLKGIDEWEAMSLTNAKLTARFLDAKKQERHDEFDYPIPDTLVIEKYTEVLDFFKDPVEYTLQNYKDKLKAATNKRTQRSLQRRIDELEETRNVYDKRMHAKATGDKRTSDALKLVLNTCYGAMKNQYNDLYDPRQANAICVGGQLLLTDLIEKLEKVKGFKLIQSNTDGIMVKYKRTDESKVFEIVEAWEKRTQLSMEYTDVLAIAQKDVNNYVMKTGEVYLVKDGVKTIEKENKGYIQTKGGYVSQYGGGDFRNNNLVVIHDALVKYFMENVPLEETIQNETDVTKFQMIAKTGSTYSGTYHEVNGQKVDVQNVNRVYATTNKKYGTLKKVKSNGREDKIAGLPDHAIIDNEGVMTLDEIDRQFYIDLANERKVDYVGKRNADKQLELQMNMEDLNNMSNETKPKPKLNNIYQKLNKVRDEFAAMDLKKTGINRYAEYKYFELETIVPAVRNLNNENNLTTFTSFTNELATLTVLDIDSGETLQFTSPMAKQAIPKGATEVQNLGAVQTYLRRYLYMLYLDIVEADEADATMGKPEAEEKAKEKKTTVKTPNTHSRKPATPTERAQAKKDVINKDGEATETQIKSIKNGLKKLREKGDYEDYIKETVLKIRGGIDKAGAEKLLLEIAGKVKE